MPSHIIILRSSRKAVLSKIFRTKAAATRTKHANKQTILSERHALSHRILSHRQTWNFLQAENPQNGNVVTYDSLTKTMIISQNGMHSHTDFVPIGNNSKRYAHSDQDLLPKTFLRKRCAALPSRH